ncbi:MAG: hypothetical protein K6B44_04240 [Lachnospiraceae bacterium]|nr:hypothetical protein [Lachnospiraceae bacterium]
MPEMKVGISEKVEKYGNDVKELSRYLDYLKSKRGTQAGSYNDPSEGKKTTILVPTYDSSLLSFVKCVQKTAFLDRNYTYVFRRYNMRTPEDELKQIERTQIMEIEVLGAILSKYVLKGMTQAKMWTEGVRNGVMYEAVSKMKELIEFWSY